MTFIIFIITIIISHSGTHLNLAAHVWAAVFDVGAHVQDLGLADLMMGKTFKALHILQQKWTFHWSY